MCGNGLHSVVSNLVLLCFKVFTKVQRSWYDLCVSLQWSWNGCDMKGYSSELLCNSWVFISVIWIQRAKGHRRCFVGSGWWPSGSASSFLCVLGVRNRNTMYHNSQCPLYDLPVDGAVDILSNGFCGNTVGGSISWVCASHMMGKGSSAAALSVIVVIPSFIMLVFCVIEDAFTGPSGFLIGEVASFYGLCS